MGEVTYLRQLDFLDPEKYQDLVVDIIGVGGIGSFTALGLAKLGLKHIRIWDGDKVEPLNIPNQLHLLKAVGRMKVESTSAILRQTSEAEVVQMPKFWAGEPLGDIVVSALDHIRKNDKEANAGREELWRHVKSNTKVRFFVDGRLGGEVIRVFSMSPMKDIFLWKWYEATLHKDEDISEDPCTARSIIDVGFFVGGLIINLVRKHLKSGTAPHDVIFDAHNLTTLLPEVFYES